MQPGHQRGRRQGGKARESILLLFSRCHAWVQTDYSNNLNHVVQLDVSLSSSSKLLFRGLLAMPLVLAASTIALE